MIHDIYLCIGTSIHSIQMFYKIHYQDVTDDKPENNRVQVWHLPVDDSKGACSLLNKFK